MKGSSACCLEEASFYSTMDACPHASVPRLGPNENTVSFQYSLPIVAPPGRNGLDPKLELFYYSRFIKNEYLGLGWTTNIPYIERINRTGAANLYTDNYFFSSFDGQLLAITVFLPPCLAGDWLTNSSTVSHGRRPRLR
jgi:Salmonella virulence plasmid 65kDa B protein